MTKPFSLSYEKTAEEEEWYARFQERADQRRRQLDERIRERERLFNIKPEKD